ncbi:MFS transporter [Paracoccus aerius]
MAEDKTLSEGVADPVRNPASRVFVASMVGTTIEYYDFYIYATAAVLVFPHLFFPAGDETASLLASLAVFGAGMVARPAGAIWFGHLGDRKGRRLALTGSLVLMGAATCLIGLLPVHDVMGWWAPLLLVILRMAQGFAIGGEWSGAVVVATENAPAGQRGPSAPSRNWAPLRLHPGQRRFPCPGDMASIRRSKPALGCVPAMGLAPALPAGWAVGDDRDLGAFDPGRKRSLSPQRGKRPDPPLPLGSLFRECGPAVVLGTLYTLATTVLFFSMSTFSLSYGRAAPDAPLPGLGYDYTSFLALLILGVMFFAATTAVSGPLSDRFGRRPLMLCVTIAIAVFGLIWVPLLSSGFWGLLIWLITGFVLMGLTFGPIGVLLSELFPSHLRYTGTGMAYNLASMLGASTAPFVMIALWRAGAGSPVWAGLYLSGVALVTLAALLVGQETRHVDILG